MRARDDFRLESMGLKGFDCVLYQLHGPGDRGFSLDRRARVLRGALVGLQAGKTKMLFSGDALRKRDARFAGFDAAAVRADVDFDEHVDFRSGYPRSVVQVANVFLVVDADTDARSFCQPGKARELARPDHFVADQHVHHAAFHHCLGLRDFLAAHADRPARHLPQCDFRTFMRFCVRAHANAGIDKRLVEPVEVAFKRIEVEQERGRVDFGEGHALAGGRRQAGRHILFYCR